MARPGPDPALVERAREMAAEGRMRAEIAAALGVSEATVKRWLARPGHRRRLPDGEGSRATLYRQRARAAAEGEQ